MKINKILSVIAGAMLLLAIPSMWPYGYYQLLRWVVSIVGIYNAYQTYKLKLYGWMITMVAVAILFNPIVPITFSKGTWVLFDIAVAIIMFVVSSKFKKEEIKKIREDWNNLFGSPNPDEETMKKRVEVLEMLEEEQNH